MPIVAAQFLSSAHSITRDCKGGISLSSTGYIQVHAYASRAQIPLQNVAVVITDKNGSAIAMRLTNRSGRLDEPVSIAVPDRAASESPNSGIIPFSSVNLYARLENYEEIIAENVQVFPGVITDQDLELIPLAEFPETWNKAEIFNTPAQNL